MNKQQIVFLGSKPIGYACLSYLIAAQEQLGVELIGILTQNRKEFDGEADLVALAQQHNIVVIDGLANLPECDILYSVQYHEILKAAHIAKARKRALNLHMAPLPEYRGSNQFSFAIIDEKEEFGTTIHLMDDRIDHGDIVFQKRFPIPPKCWVSELYQLTLDTSVRLFQQTLSHAISGNFRTVSQADMLVTKGTSLHYRHEMVELKRIDLDWDATKIEKHIRATSMPGFEPPYCDIDGHKVYFSKKMI